MESLSRETLNEIRLKYDVCQREDGTVNETFLLALGHVYIPQLLDRIEKLEDALRFYLGEEDEGYAAWIRRMGQDCGQRAKEALNNE